MTGRTLININGYTVYDNVDESDDQFDLILNASLVLLGYDTLTDDALTGTGQLHVRGEVAIGGLSLDDAVTLVNTQLAVQSGLNDDEVEIGQSPSDAATIRNIGGAIWDLTNNANVTSAGTSQFVNLGLLELTSGDSTIDADFFNRGGTVEIQEGELSFTGSVERFIKGAVTGAGTLDGDDVVLDATAISVASASFNEARILGDVVVSSAQFSCPSISLGAGSTLEIVGLPSNSQLYADLFTVTGAGKIALAGAENVDVGLGLTLIGDVGFINYGETAFYGYVNVSSPFGGTLTIAATPWADDQIVIENAPGAVWTAEGNSDVLLLHGASTGGATFDNFGTFVGTESVSFSMNLVNDGVVEAPDQFAFYDPVTGNGVVELEAGLGYVQSSFASSQTLEFAAPSYGPQTTTLILDDAVQFAGVVSGFDQNGATDDTIALNSPTSTPWQFEGYTENSAGTGGSLMFTNGAANEAVQLLGNYNAADFHATETTGIPGRIYYTDLGEQIGDVSGNFTAMTYSSNA